MNPKILIGCPTHVSKDYALEQYAKGIKNLTYKNFDVLLVDNSDDDSYMEKIKKHGFNVVKGTKSKSTKKRIVDSRNILRKHFLEGNYDYLFSLEQDVIPPVNAIERFLKVGVPIVSGVYLHISLNNFGKPELKPLAYYKATEEEFKLLKNDKSYEGTQIRKDIESGKIKGPDDLRAQLSVKDAQSKELQTVHYTGLGCMFIRRDVLEKIEFRTEEDSFDDYAFCMDAQKQGYEIWLDSKVSCGHILSKEADKRN